MDSDFQALLALISATPLAYWPTGGAPAPVADNTSPGSDPRPSHPGNPWSVVTLVDDGPGGANPRLTWGDKL
ncbi:hypothetical protein F5146DRAFT_1143736 [Armillaria mellea]|nr:hypothetical protein F5146DRAFT_1143736 [Armillaria mellea]